MTDDNLAPPSGGSRWEAPTSGAGVVRTTKWVEETRRYRRNPGGWWWLALLLIPALLALLGTLGSSATPTKKVTSTGTATAPTTGTQSGTASTGTPQTTGATGDLGNGVFAVARDGSGLTLTATTPDTGAKGVLIGMVKAAVPGTAVTDKVSVAAGAKGPDPAALAGVVASLAKVSDFGLAYDLKTVTVTGTGAADVKTAVGAAVAKAWPKATVENAIVAGTDAAAGCAVLEDRIRVALASNKINFAKQGSTLTAASKALVGSVAGLVKPCADANLTVTGFTDGTGAAAYNKLLSRQRADAVKTALAAAGVPSARITAVGKGSASPVASDATATGRLANRRVEITVG